jgi:predicted NACHT family NTPase
VPEDLPNRTNASLLVTAPAGYGKTSFCKWNFLNDVRLLGESKSDVVPVYVPLHQLATVPVSNSGEVFLRSDDVKQMVHFAKEKGRRIRFYLDGLDEVSTTDQQRRLMELASQLPTLMPTAQVVVTGRDYVTGHWLGWLARVNLAELTEEQVKEFITNYLGEDAGELERFNEQLEKSRTLRPLMHVPLLGTLIVAVFRKMQSLPENKVKLYEIFVDLMCGGWDIAKNVRRDTRFGSTAKLAILTRLAGHLQINERREAEESDIRTVIKESFPAHHDSWRSVLSELLEDGLLVRLAGGLGFAHLSFQEYLAAKDLTTDPTGERQKQVLRRFLRGEDWWREVLAFYLSMTQRPDEVAGWIKSVGLKISRDLRSQDIGKRWDFLMGCLQSAAPGWVAPELRPPLKP